MSLWFPALVGLWLAAAPASQPGAPTPGQSYAAATLDCGVTLGFALVRTGGTPNGSGPIGEVVFPRSNGVSRVLYDQAAGTYFGYRVELKREGKEGLLVTLKPLGPGVDQELKRHCPSCPWPKQLTASQPRFPAPRPAADGDIITLDLLIKPETGEKIVDVIRLSSKQPTPDFMSVAVERIRESLSSMQRADYLVVRRDYKGAVEEIKKALAINPNDASAHNKLGMCYQYLRDTSGAQRQYEEAVSLNPGYAEAWNNLGSLYHQRGKHKQAIKYYQKAVKLKPTFATTWKNLGTAYLSDGRYEEGYQAYQTAFRLNPGVFESNAPVEVQTSGNVVSQYYYFAKLSAASGQLDAALGFLKKAQGAGFKNWDRVRADSDFAQVIKDPRFDQIVHPGPAR
jgi:Tfp pilus assembly protein PilF